MSRTLRTCLSSFSVPEDRLYKARRAFVLWLQGLFKQREPGNYMWTDDDQTTEIAITSTQPTNTQETNLRPIIVVERTTGVYMGISRDSRLKQNLSGSKFTVSDLISFSVIITVVAREGVEAEAIAFHICRMFQVFRRPLQRLGQIHGFDNRVQFSAETAHGAIVAGSSVPEWRASQIVFPTQIQDVIDVDTTEGAFASVIKEMDFS